MIENATLFKDYASLGYMLAFVMAVLSTGLLLIRVLKPEFQALSPFQRSADAVTALMLLLVFVYRSLAAGYFALTNMYESVLAVALGLVLCRYLIEPRLRAPVFHFAAMVLVLFALGFALRLPQDIQVLQPALMSYWRAIHVPIIMFSYALLFLASVAGVLALLQGKEGEATSPSLDAPSALHLADKAVYLAVPTLAIGTALGAVWANEAWGTYWNWDPKENMALATLFVYGAYLHLRLNSGLSGRVLCWLLVAGFAVLMLTYIGINVMGVGLHSYGNFM